MAAEITERTRDWERRAHCPARLCQRKKQEGPPAALPDQALSSAAPAPQLGPCIWRPAAKPAPPVKTHIIHPASRVKRLGYFSDRKIVLVRRSQHRSPNLFSKAAAAPTRTSKIRRTILKFSPFPSPTFLLSSTYPPPSPLHTCGNAGFALASLLAVHVLSLITCEQALESRQGNRDRRSRNQSDGHACQFDRHREAEAGGEHGG